MGTSQSSKGSPSGVPMVPPWVPEVDVETNDNEEEQLDEYKGNDKKEIDEADIATPQIAPRGRFKLANQNLNSYSKYGDSDSMKKGVGHYVKQGYGGASGAVRRFGGSIAAGAALFSALNEVSKGESVGGFSLRDLRSKSTKEIVDILIDVVRPVDGTQDAEAGRSAVQTALSELLSQDENIDLLNLTEEQCLFVTERYIADDIFRRIQLDVGKNVQDNAPTISSAVARLREIKNYIKQTVAVAFRKTQNALESINSTRIKSILKSALTETFSVFEEYIQ